jgi:hypothetical protein
VPQSSTQSTAEKIDIKRLCGTLRLLSVRCVKKLLTCSGRKNGKSLVLLINGLQLRNHKFVALKRTSQDEFVEKKGNIQRK